MALLSVPGGGREHCKDEFALPDFQFSFQVHGTHWRSVESGWAYPEHEHPLLELNLVLEGRQRTKIDERIYEQAPGDLMIIPPGCMHASEAGSDEGMTYFCLHLDIDDRSFAYFMYHHPQLFYASNTPMARRLRPILDDLMDASRHSPGMSLVERIRVRACVLNLLIVLSEQTLLDADDLPMTSDVEDANRGSSLEIMRLREQNLLETRVQDLFYEPQMPGLPVDKSLYPPHRWIGLFSFTSPDKQFWMKPDRFWAKTLLEDVLSPSGSVVIVMEHAQMTATVFSNQIAVPDLVTVMAEARDWLQQKLNIVFVAGFGGITADISEMRTMYLQSLQAFNGESTDPAMDRKMVEFIHRIIRMAMSHIQYEYANRELSLSVLAEKLDVTPNYLSALFTSETGMTFTQHLTHVRMEQAKQLLAGTNLKIYQICHNVGYADQAYFSRLFKSLEGLSPYDYRLRAELNE